MVRGGMTTEVGGIGHALATYNWIPWGTDASRLNEDLTFQAAESMEEKGNHNGSSCSKDK